MVIDPNPSYSQGPLRPGVRTPYLRVTGSAEHLDRRAISMKGAETSDDIPIHTCVSAIAPPHGRPNLNRAAILELFAFCAKWNKNLGGSGAIHGNEKRSNDVM